MKYPLVTGIMINPEHIEIAEWIEKLMTSYNDPAHNFSHILRVYDTVKNMFTRNKWPRNDALYDVSLLIALCHDVFDNKTVAPERQNEVFKEREEHLTKLLEERYEAIGIDYAIRTIKMISWSQYRKREYVIPNFAELGFGTASELFRKIWMIVSNADWYDAQLLIRCYEYNKKNNKGLNHEDNLKMLKHHWDEKLGVLHEHAYFDMKSIMTERYEEQKVILEECLKEAKIN